jgi:D-alanyl-D-alanine endopeptidase (penicillin-binding protein 7)
MNKLIIILALVSINAFAKETEPSVLHFDSTENKMEYNQNISKVRSMASLTKLMTAMVSLDYDSNMLREVELKPLASTKLPKRNYKRSELFHAMLIRSDNGAAETIASDYPGGRAKFIAAMNNKAQKMGLTSTYYKDPTGLSASNVSTALDVMDIVTAASTYSIIRETSVKKQAIIEMHHKKKVRTIALKNTNHALLFEFDNVITSKTGYTVPAGWCVAMMVERLEKAPETDKDFIDHIVDYYNGKPKVDPGKGVIHRHVIVVMGAKNPKDRIDKVKDIMYNEILDNELPEEK